MLTSKSLIDRLWELIEARCEGKQTVFAEKVGAPTSTVNHWLNSGTAPKPEHLAAMRDRLGVNLNWLLTGQGEKYIKAEAPAAAERDDGGYIADDTAEKRAEREELLTLIHNFSRLSDVGKGVILNNIDAFLQADGKGPAEKVGIIKEPPLKKRATRKG